MSNENLHVALKKKDDEYYTFLADVENECNHYTSLFKDKNIFLPCDDTSSAFWKYFYNHFNEFQLKSLTATSLNMPNGNYFYTSNGIDISHKSLIGNGDFQSQEVQEIIKIADIVVTNPPFSLFRKLIELLESYNKLYLLIGNENTLASTIIFPLIKDEKVHLGFNKIKTFMQPNGDIKTFGNISWFTNLPIEKEIEPLTLTKMYNPEINLEYDNFQAINVDRITDIPMDYYGVMGVPVSYMTKHNKEQFKILGLAAGNTKVNGLNFTVKYTPSKLDRGGCGVVKGIRKYSRVFIQRKDIK